MISGNKTLKIGHPRTFVAKFTNEEGNEIINPNCLWNVIGDVNVIVTPDGDKVELLVEDEFVAGKSFTLCATDIDSMAEVKSIIEVTEGF